MLISFQAYVKTSNYFLVDECIAIGLLSKCAKVLKENEAWTKWGVNTKRIRLARKVGFQVTTQSRQQISYITADSLSNWL